MSRGRPRAAAFPRAPAKSAHVTGGPEVKAKPAAVGFKEIKAGGGKWTMLDRKSVV